MGRALFSTIYRSTPAVHEEPEPEPNDVPTYATWSHKNMFDPDSDEFFVDAEYEAFISQEEYAHDQLLDSRPVSASPMAMGDDPANLVPGGPRLWTAEERIFTVEDAGSRWRVTLPMPGSDNTMRLDTGASFVQPIRPTRGDESTIETVNRVLHSLTSATSQDLTTDDENEDNQPPPPLPTLSMPIPIPRAQTPSSGSATPSPPSTPPQAYSWGSITTPNQGISMSMSPPPPESPRLYSWARARYSVSPSSPPTSRGPLTNPSARASFPRLAAGPTILRA